MPWKAADAQQHNSKANTPNRQRLWAKVANRTYGAMERSGHPDEGAAIRTANAAVDRAYKQR